MFLFIYFYICQTLPKCLTLNSRYILSYMNQTYDQTMCHCHIWLNWLFPFLPHEGAGRWVWLGFELNLLDAWPLPFSLDALCLDYCMDYHLFWFCPSCHLHMDPTASSLCHSHELVSMAQRKCWFIIKYRYGCILSFHAILENIINKINRFKSCKEQQSPQFTT